MIRESLKWVETQDSVHCPLQKLFLAIGVKTCTKADIKVSWSCPILLDFLAFLTYCR